MGAPSYFPTLPSPSTILILPGGLSTGRWAKCGQCAIKGKEEAQW